MWNDDATFLGLGYRQASGGAQDPQQTTPAVAAPIAHDAVQALMQQCLAYHEEQEVMRQQHQQQVLFTTDSVGSSLQFAHSGAVLPAAAAPDAKKYHDGVPTEEKVRTPDASVTINDDDAHRHQQINDARIRAQEILVRFQLQQQQRALEVGASDPPAATSVFSTDSVPHSDAAVSPAVFAEQRRVGLQRESERKHRALIKNLEYVAAKESQRIQQLSAAVEDTSAREQMAHQQYLVNLEQRKQRILSAGTGALPGAKPRRKESSDRTNPAGATKLNEASRTVAIYIAGLPETVADEVYVRQLFGGYGSVCKVHLYRDKRSGRLKGDALVVYAIDGVTSQARALVGKVCGQVSGQWSPPIYSKQCRTMESSRCVGCCGDAYFSPFFGRE